MSGALGQEPEGATPLTDEDLDGLIPSWVATKGNLNRAEAENILRARAGIQRSQRRPSRWYLEPGGLETLHREMFGNVWRWAGTLRRREANIGIDPYRISAELHNLREDVRAQIGDGENTAYPVVELAVRFHHRLVAIHPFPNGNGRHSRFSAELVLADLGGSGLTWGGGGDLVNASQLRQDYLAALRLADRGEFGPLIEFAVRS